MKVSTSPAVNDTLYSDRNSPFVIENEHAYYTWREQKLRNYPLNIKELIVPVTNPCALTLVEREAVLRICRKTNMVIYSGPTNVTAGKRTVHEISRAFGLSDLDRNLFADEDGVSALAVRPEKSDRGYIPYSDKRMQWHTDGYYNTSDTRIRSFLLHCVRSAAHGGENQVLDHEIAYILLRDAAPAYVRALMHPAAMKIPANTEDPTSVRPARTGPVFFVDPLTSRLYLRYTARTRSIVWRSDNATRAAVAFLDRLLAGDSPYIFRYRLGPGEGLLCNNILHGRSAFVDHEGQNTGRLIYRARYHNRIAGT